LKNKKNADRVAGVDIRAVLQELQHFLSVSPSRRSQEGGAVVRLKRKKDD